MNNLGNGRNQMNYIYVYYTAFSFSCKYGYCLIYTLQMSMLQLRIKPNCLVNHFYIYNIGLDLSVCKLILQIRSNIFDCNLWTMQNNSFCTSPVTFLTYS